MRSFISKIVASIVFTVAFTSGVFAAELGNHVDPTPEAQKASEAKTDGFFNVSKTYPTDLVVGYSDAPVTVIEYGSLTCPHCAYFDAHVFPDFKSQLVDTHKVRYVYRHFPLDQLAALAAAAVSCLPADEQLQAISALYEDQSKSDGWVKASDYKNGIGKLFNSTFGEKYKADQVMSCIKDSDKFKATMTPAFEARQANAITGTPFFFINGKPYLGDRTVAAFEAAISAPTK